MPKPSLKKKVKGSDVDFIILVVKRRRTMTQMEQKRMADR